MVVFRVLAAVALFLLDSMEEGCTYLACGVCKELSLLHP